MSTKFPATPETFHLFLLLPYNFVPMSFSAMLDKERVPKKCCKKSGLLTNPPRPPTLPICPFFLSKKLPQIIFENETLMRETNIALGPVSKS